MSKYSHDLSSWQTFNGAETISSVDATWERVGIVLPEAAGTGRVFGRFEISQE